MIFDTSTKVNAVLFLDASPGLLCLLSIQPRSSSVYMWHVFRLLTHLFLEMHKYFYMANSSSRQEQILGPMLSGSFLAARHIDLVPGCKEAGMGSEIFKIKVYR